MPRLEHTSVPLWFAAVGAVGDPDTSGSSYLLVGVGAAGEAQVAAWASVLEEYDVKTLLGSDPAVVGAELEVALERCRVGVRLRIAAPVGACLSLRSAAVMAGVEDDELFVAPTGAGPIQLWCAHCGSVTETEAGIDDVVSCAGCARRLLVYFHVSRRTGHVLGFQVDAEDQPRGIEDLAS